MLFLSNEPVLAYPLLNTIHGSNVHSSLQEILAVIFDVGSGVFAAFIIVISLIAYRNLKSKRLLLITLAFVFFLVRSILSRLDLFMPETLELLLAGVSFAGLILFSVAVLQMGRLWMNKRPTV